MTNLRAENHLLNARISWLHLLGHLGINCPSSALPARTYCPLCKKESLQILMDRSSGGQWFHCLSCRNHGDMIELAAKTWRLRVSATIQKLAREGFDLPTNKDTIQLYIERYVRGRQRMTNLWKQAQRDTIHSSTTLCGLVHELKLHCEAPASRWKKGFGQLVGGIDRLIVEKTIYPGSVASRQRTSKWCDSYAGNPSMGRVFKGHEWGDVLLIPFYDLPGKICSFLFIGRKGNPKKDFVFRRINYHTTKRIHTTTEAGLAFHPDTLTTADAEWQRTVFAVRDPTLALELQARHFEGSTRPLPLIIWHEGLVGSPMNTPDRTQYAWEMLEGRQVIFWMPKVDIALLRQAALVDGMISTAGPEKPTSAKLKRYTWKFPPADLLEHIRRQAKPWHHVLSDMVDVLPDAVVEELFIKLKNTGEHVLRLVQRCRPASRAKLRKIFKEQNTLSIISYNRHTILELKDGWYLTGPQYSQDEPILGGIIRVDHWIYHPRTGQTYLEGRILLGGDRTVPFCEREETIEKNPYQWAKETVKSKIGVPLLGKKQWSKALLEIAYEFSKPVFTEGIDVVGWNPDGGQFVLPRYAICTGGEIESGTGAMFPSDTPAQSLEWPEELNASQLDPVTTIGHTSQLFWANMAAILSNILAPAFTHQTSGIGLCGKGAEIMGLALARAIGCLEFPGCRAKDLETAVQLEPVHGWPLIAGTSLRHTPKFRQTWVNDDRNGSRNCITWLSQLAGLAKAVQTGWHVVMGEETVCIEKKTTQLACRLVPAYLLDLAKRNFCMRLWNERPETWFDEVLQDLAGYVKRVGGKPEAVLAAREMVWPDSKQGHAEAFADLLGALVKQGLFVLAPRGFDGGRTKSLVYTKPGEQGIEKRGLFIPTPALAEILAGKHIRMPDPNQISDILARAGVLLVNHQTGWTIDERWWTKRQNHQQTRLQLYAEG